MKFEDQKMFMIERHIIARGIEDSAIIDAFDKVPRHLFVPEELRRYSYQDCPLKIGYNQTISQPYIVAIMLSLLNLSPEESVLEIGTGSGYQTALLAEIAKDVYTVERIPELMSAARFVLDGLGYENIFYRIGDGTKGWEKAFPIKKSFNKIIVSAAAPETPPSLVEQLAEDGKLVIPAGSRWHQDLRVITLKNGTVIDKKCGECTFVPLIGSEGWKE